MKLRIGLALGAALLFAGSLLNGLRGPLPEGPTLLAHRGLAQAFSREDLQGDTCTAARMLPPRHGYLENTLPSMRAAFDLGADWVELDIHPTTDGHFAVFHDWTLDCRTNGTGVTREHSLAELKALDIGYGYTADGGRTFPFRGTAVGAMPSLDEVLAAFPEGRLLINIKSDDPQEGALLATFLQALPAARIARLAAYGGDAPIDVLRERVPGLRTLSRPNLKACLARYAAIGWTGRAPEACAGSLVFVPVNVGPWLWGWPTRFQSRMEEVGSLVFTLAPYTGGWSEGLDDAAALELLPEGYRGGIWTDAIDVVGPLVRGEGRSP